jgi:hypothetical protein
LWRKIKESESGKDALHILVQALQVKGNLAEFMFAQKTWLIL